MPHERVRFKPRRELLTYEEIERFVRVVARLGVSKLRITGGEPLVRLDLDELVRSLARLPGIDDLALTTNGILLAEQAEALKAAGLHRLNISLDTLREETFQQIARRDDLPRVLEGIAAAKEVGFSRIRLNAVAIRGLTEEDIIPLARFARRAELELRFIEFMPLDADGQWDDQQVLAGEEIKRQVEQVFGPLTPASRPDPSQPATDYDYADGGRIGFINPVTQPFCEHCNRLRITAEGQVRNCLFSHAEWDARKIIRSGAGDESIRALIRECIAAKKTGHGIDSPDFTRPLRAMYQIGG
jgi:cyclic pyranopterin phosphate synthase